MNYLVKANFFDWVWVVDKGIFCLVDIRYQVIEPVGHRIEVQI